MKNLWFPLWLLHQLSLEQIPLIFIRIKHIRHIVVLHANHLNISLMIFGFKGDVSSIRMEIAIGPNSDIITMSRRTWNLKRSRDGSCRPLLHLTTVATDRSVFRREKGVWSPVVSNVCVVVLPVVITLLLCKSVSLSVRLSVYSSVCPSRAIWEWPHARLAWLARFLAGCNVPDRVLYWVRLPLFTPGPLRLSPWREHYSCYCNRKRIIAFDNHCDFLVLPI